MLSSNSTHKQISKGKEEIKFVIFISSQFMLTTLRGLERIVITPNMISISNQQKTLSFNKEIHVKKLNVLYDCRDGLI